MNPLNVEWLGEEIRVITRWNINDRTMAEREMRLARQEKKKTRETTDGEHKEGEHGRLKKKN